MRCVSASWTAAFVVGLVAVTQAAAQPACQNSGSFEAWLSDFRAEATRQGVSRTALASLDGMTLDPGIIARDRKQGFFSQTFLDVVDKLATRSRILNGQAALVRHKAIFERAEQRYGVPPAPIAAFWALESDFGAGMGKLPVLRSLATLAYDCRRGDKFRPELLAALRIIDRGDLKPAEMIGSWAGELGQTQFLPSHYWNYAVDFDGDGRRDLLRSSADVIGSSAAFLQSLGWQRGQPWLEEVRVPERMPWAEADLSIRHPRSQWIRWGVSYADGRPLPNDALSASLHLPMGRFGPAFLAYDNFQIYLKWNQAINYTTTAAYLATRIAGAPALNRGGSGLIPYGIERTRDLQSLLNQAGFYKADVDGRLGALTRSAIKAAQIEFGLPADAYPSTELEERLRRR